MSSNSVVFHCNANESTGFGHLMRCLALAQETSRREWETFVAGRLGEAALQLASQTAPNAKFRVFNTNNDVADLSAICSSLRPSIIHLDSYAPALRHFNKGGAILSNAQDGSFGARPADITIDANLGAEHRWHQDKKAGLALLGTSVMQIRDEVRQFSHKVRPTLGSRLKVLVVLGGTDPVGASPLVVEAIARSGVATELTVVCRESLHRRINIAFSFSNSSTITLHKFVTDLPKLANLHDLVITAAGTSTWDFAAMGIPMALISTVDNHKAGYEASVASGLALPLGVLSEGRLTEHMRVALNAAIKTSVREELAAKGRSLVDGRGTQRIVNAWEKF